MVLNFRIDKGTIKKIGDNYVEATIVEEVNECATCPMNKFCKAGISVKLKVDVPKKYTIGQIIDIRVYTTKRFLLQIYIFIMPLFSLLLGIISGVVIFKNEGIGVILGVVFFVISLVINIIISRKKERVLYELTEDKNEGRDIL